MSMYKNSIRKRIFAMVSALLIVLPINIFGLQERAYATQSKADKFVKTYTISGDPARDIVAVARAQAGRTQESLGYTEAWCANFVSDSARLAGASKAIPANGGSTTLFKNVINAGGKVVTSAQAGDLVFYKENAKSYFHVGIMISPSLSVQGNLNSRKDPTRKVYDAIKPSAVSGTYVFVRPNYAAAQIDTINPVIKNATVSNITSEGFDVSCIATDNVGVTRVSFPTWTQNNGQDDLMWHEAVHSGGRWTAHIKTSQHKGESGYYISHVYAYDNAGNTTSDGVGTFLVGTFACDIKLDKADIQLKKGESHSLKTTVYPENAVDKTVTWSTSDAKVAVVSNGDIKAVGEGTATIKAVLRNASIYGHNTATCTVKVVAVKEEQTEAEKSNSADKTAIKQEEPSSYNEAVENKNNDAEAETRRESNVEPEYRHEKETDEKTYEAESSVSRTVNLKLATTSAIIDVGESGKLQLLNAQRDLNGYALNWKSSNPAVVAVDNGTVKGIGDGTATVTVYAVDSASNTVGSASCEIKVISNISQRVDVQLYEHSTQMNVGGSTYLNADVISQKPFTGSLKWTTSDPAVAVVENGTVRAVGAGTAYITVSIGYIPPEGRFSDRCEITVVDNSKATTYEEEYTGWQTYNDTSNAASNGGTILRSGNYKASGVTETKNVSQSGSIITVSNGSGSRSYYRAADGTYRDFDSDNMYLISVTGETSFTYSVVDPETNARKLRLYYNYN